jgi:adenylate cyclase
VALALRDPLLRQVSDEKPTASGLLTAEGRNYLVSFRSLESHGRPGGGIHDWRIAILVPEEFYLGGLLRTRNHLLALSLLVIALIVAGGALTLTAVRRGLARIVNETTRMRRFEFTSSSAEAPFRDVREAMESLELAKTAMRAMGKYVPVDLVRRLYETNRDPVLGGELLEVSLMFTDIKDFTALAEGLAPDRLARVLGLYLEAMTGAIHATEGTVDKYIGDAVMALWNAPRPCADHAVRACRAALACAESTARLYASPAWEGLPALVTRFGLNRDQVMVGHFGAPDRLSYTALGDGVNLASRIEGLNKQYGTTILAAESVYEAARESFAFRRLDRVAVRGRTQGTLVYELLGPAGGEERPPAITAYEEALEAYFARDFARALRRLEGHGDDPPSRVLAERCRRLRAEPPPPGWDGISVAATK